jgi:hypothetical protein
LECKKRNEAEMKAIVERTPWEIGISAVYCDACDEVFDLPDFGYTKRNVKALRMFAKGHRCWVREEQGRLSIVPEAGQVSLTDEGALSLEEQ